MQNLSTVLSVFPLFLLSIEKSPAQSNSTFWVKGVIDTVPFATYFVTYRQGDVWTHDTVSLDAERRFEYTGNIVEPTTLNLNIGNINPKFAGDANVYSFWVEPGKTTSFKGKSNWKVKGLYGLVARGKIDYLEPSEMEKTDQHYDEILKKAIWKREECSAAPLGRTELRQINDSVRFDFIHRHPNNFYSLDLIYRGLDGGEAAYAFAEVAWEGLSEELRNTPTGKLVARRLTVNKLVGIGKVMPDFEQSDTSSNPVKLSDFRGKYVFVDFWASWCGPCRKEHPHLVEAYGKFASKGFDILGVSLDSKKESWLQAIEEDELDWTQVSDLKGFNNSVAKQFFIHAIPNNFLLDPDGVIIAKGLRGGELLRRLELIFEENIK